MYQVQVLNSALEKIFIQLETLSQFISKAIPRDFSFLIMQKNQILSAYATGRNVRRVKGVVHFACGKLAGSTLCYLPQPLYIIEMFSVSKKAVRTTVQQWTFRDDIFCIFSKPPSVAIFKIGRFTRWGGPRLACRKNADANPFNLVLKLNVGDKT